MSSARRIAWLSGWLAGWGWACLGLAQDQTPESPASLSGYSASQAYEIQDGVPLEPESRFLRGLLFRVKKISAASLLRFESYSRNIGWDQVREDPRKYRFWIRRVAGTVVRMTRTRLADGGEGLPGYFEVELKSTHGSALVITREVPTAWLQADPAGQPASATGFFLQLATREGAKYPVLVSQRIAWYPNQANVGMGVTPSQVVLGQAGFDVGRLDNVRQQNKRPLGEKDSAAFYGLLAAAAQIEATDMPEQRVGFEALIRASTRHIGDAVSLRGRVRRCVPIAMDTASGEEDSMSGYFELDLFQDLDGKHVVLTEQGQESLEYRDRFPVTVCVLALPSGFTVDAMEGQQVRVDGFFYRIWSYEAEFTGRERGQVSPLVVGLTPQIIASGQVSLDRFLMGAMLLLVGGVLGLAWWARQGSRVSRERALPDRMDLPAGLGEQDSGASGDDIDGP